MEKESSNIPGFAIFLNSLNAICANSSCDFGDDNANAVLADTSLFELVDAIYNKTSRYDDLAASLKGKIIKVVTYQNEPLNGAIKDENGDWIGTGIAFTFMNLMAKKYEFNYTVVVPNENILGDNTTGVFGMLVQKQADVAAAFLPIFAWLRSSVEFAYQLDVGEWVVLLKRPSESATGSGLLAPFDYQVWILIFISLVCVGPIIHLIIIIRMRLCPEDEKNKVYPLSSCVWFVYGALLKQGTTLSPFSDSTRMLFATWWIFITILTAFYTANLTAFLTLSKFTLPIEKPGDLANGKYKWIAQKGQAIEEMVLNGNELSFLTPQINGRFEDVADALIMKNFVDKGYMYMRDKPAVEHIMYQDYLNKTKLKIAENLRCTYVITKWPMLKLPRSFAFRRDFEWADLFNLVLKSLVEAGIVIHKLRDDLPDTTICPLDLREQDRKLHNSDLLMTYEVVAGGFVIAIATFICEFIYRKYKSRPKSGAWTTSNNNYPDYFKTNNKQIPPPPPYHTIFQEKFSNPPDTPEGKKKIINGRDYWVIKNHDGDTRLIPVRTPSALLFQYTQ